MRRHRMIDHLVFRSGAAVVLAGCTFAAEREPRWPGPLPAPASSAVEQRADDARIRAQPVCVGSLVWSAGELGDSIAYRTRRVGNKLHVGYFVYWSSERPWGNNAMTHTLLPALATDMVYSHSLFVFPGLREVLYGAGDVEGATVEFEESPTGKLRVVGGTADDGSHHAVALTPSDLEDAQGRVVLLTRVWSHQLGAHGAAAFASDPAHSLRCYERGAIRPLTSEQARAFRLGTPAAPRRAKPAWK
jgi:hypothetical protein